MTSIRHLLLPLAALAMAAPAAAQQTASERLRQLFADDWEVTLRENPTFATSLGDRRFNHLLDPAAPEDVRRRTEENRRFLARLEAIPRDSLTPDERIHYDIFGRQARLGLEEVELGLHLIPITNREGFHTWFPQLPDNVPLNNTEDYENYVARLNAFRPWVGQHVALMREGVRTGMVLPSVSLAGIEETHPAAHRGRPRAEPAVEAVHRLSGGGAGGGPRAADGGGACGDRAVGGPRLPRLPAVHPVRVRPRRPPGDRRVGAAERAGAVLAAGAQRTPRWTLRRTRCTRPGCARWPASARSWTR